MRTNTRLTSRTIAICAAACAAALIPAVALAAPTHSAVHKATTPPCQTPALTSWLGTPGDGYAGGVGYQLEISNISHSACTLDGYPYVRALGQAGKLLGSAAGEDASHPVTQVTLAPGATAHSILLITDVSNFPPSSCKPAAADMLRVYPPNQTRAQGIPFSFQACSKTGPVYLRVSPTLAGTGIPGFSS